MKTEDLYEDYQMENMMADGGNDFSNLLIGGGGDDLGPSDSVNHRHLAAA